LWRVLFLRGFVMRAARYSGVTVMTGGGESIYEPQIRKHVVNALAPVPLLWVANPVDLGTLELARSAACCSNARALKTSALAEFGADGVWGSLFTSLTKVSCPSRQ